MSEKKTIIQTLQDFSQKLEKFSQTGATQLPSDENCLPLLKKIQNQINVQKRERQALLRTQFQEFVMPMSQEIEKDEEALVNAYNLFCQLKELNDKTADRQTRLKSLALSSPLCHKTEYMTSSSPRFALLRLWFLTTKPDAKFVPEISVEFNGSHVLEFTDIELWKPTTFEKEIMQAFSS